MARKLRVYLENSLISMYFQDDAPYLRDRTRRFWRDVLPACDIFVSEAVLAEITSATEADLRRALEGLVEDFEVLEVAENVVELSDLYLAHRRLPRADALHLAAATVGEMDYLVTWNLRHLYKRGTQEMIREVNARLGFPTPTIVTPEDFFGEEGQDA